MNRNKNIFTCSCIVFCFLLLLAACSKKQDLFPQNDLTAEKVYSTYDGYKSILAKIYAGMAIGGNQGPSGMPDISGGLDEGSQISFIRPFFNCQELPTDEAVCYWNDQTIKNYHYFKYDNADPFIKGMYARPIWNITLINEYLRESSDDNLNKKGFTTAQVDDIKKGRAEARFLRAFNYWVMMDIFGKSTFITENDIPNPNVLPTEISRAGLYTYVSNELKGVENELGDARSAVYGRIDKGAAWALMARLQLNANVYLGTTENTHYDTAILYSQKVINAGYSLHPNYSQLFMADNNVTSTDEIIWAIECDGLSTQSYGNTSFLVNAPSGADKGTNYFTGAGGAGWTGYTATKNLFNLFKTGDNRAMFNTSLFGTSPAQIEITDDLLTVNESKFPSLGSGLHVNKFRNIRSDGKAIRDNISYTYADIDFPVFRLAEMYLIYSEAVLRGGSGGSMAQAVAYYNKLRERAYGNTSGDIASLAIGDILDERGRELYWEGHRRTDLIRYGYLTSGSYLWPWKGGARDGIGVDAKYNLYPIPTSVRNSNPNLSQNAGF